MEAQSQTRSLRAEEANVGNVDEQRKRAEIFSLNADTVSRAVMVVAIAALFIWLNWSVMSLVGRAFDQDVSLMQRLPQAFKPSDRVITANVFMSLIGGTVVQVGVATVTIVSYLFPKKSSAPGGLERA